MSGTSAGASKGWESRWTSMLERGEEPTGARGREFAEQWRAEIVEREFTDRESREQRKYDPFDEEVYEGAAWDSDYEWEY